MSILSVMPSNHLILCRPLLLLPSPSIRVFSNESALHIRWPKYWSFGFSISPSNEHPGLISFRMDWLDHLAAQGTLKSLLQHHSSKASILLCSAFFIVQLSHAYMTTGKTGGGALVQTLVMGYLMTFLVTRVTTGWMIRGALCSHQERTLDFLPPFQWHQVFLCCRCCSVAQLCPTLRDSMDCSTPALPVFHHLPEFAQW